MLRLWSRLTSPDGLHDELRVLGVRISQWHVMEINLGPGRGGSAQRRCYTYLGGLLASEEWRDRIGRWRMALKVMGVTVHAACRTPGGYDLGYVLGLKVRERPAPFLEEFRQTVACTLGSGYDAVYIFFYGLEDTYRMLLLLNTLRGRHHCQNPLLLATTRTQLELAGLLYPHLPCKYVDGRLPCMVALRQEFRQCEFSLDERRYYLMYNRWAVINTEQDARPAEILGTGCDDAELCAQREKCSEFAAVAAWYGVHVAEDAARVAVPQELREQVLAKSREGGLDVRRFVFLDPISICTPEHSSSFWVALAEAALELGYAVYAHIAMGGGRGPERLRYTSDPRLHSELIAAGCRFFRLGLSEALVLAGMARRVVAVRSDLTPLLLECGAPMDVLYYGASREAAAHDILRRSLREYPGWASSRVREFNAMACSGGRLLREIVDELQSSACRQQIPSESC